MIELLMALAVFASSVLLLALTLRNRAASQERHCTPSRSELLHRPPTYAEAVARDDEHQAGVKRRAAQRQQRETEARQNDLERAFFAKVKVRK